MHLLENPRPPAWYLCDSSGCVNELVAIDNCERWTYDKQVFFIDRRWRRTNTQLLKTTATDNITNLCPEAQSTAA